MLFSPTKTNLVLKINMLRLGEPEFATIQNTSAVAQIQNAIRDARTTFLTYRKKISPPRASLGRGIRGGPLGDARNWTLRRYGVFSVTYEVWSWRIFRSLTE